MLIGVAMTMPQTSSEFHALYGKPDAEVFTVRPGIVLSVEYGEDGDACAMRIEPRTDNFTSSLNAPPADMDKMTEVLNEVLPVQERGMELMGPVPPGCYEDSGGDRPVDYQNVTVKTFYPYCSKPMVPRGIEVRFKRPACDKVKPETFPPPASKPN
jgi:hypothetical protein